MGPPDGMDRREVDDVEAELSDPGQLPLRVGEGAVPRRVAGGRSREQLVPRREGRVGRVRADRVLSFAVAEAFGRGVGGHERQEVLGRRPSYPRGGIARRIAERFGEAGQPSVIVSAGVGLGLPDELGSLQELGADVESSGHLLFQLAAPGGEPVHPGLDGEPPFTHAVEPDRGSPPVSLEGVSHRNRLDALLPGRAEAHAGREDVGAVLEYVGFDPKLVVDHPLHRVSAAVEHGSDAGDHDVGRAAVEIACERSSPLHGTQRSLARQCWPPPATAAHRDADHPCSGA